MAVVPMWHSTIFGPYFVVGANLQRHCGTEYCHGPSSARTLHLEKYLQPIHFRNLGKLMFAMSLLWGYFVFNERLVTWYGNTPHEMAALWSTQMGPLLAAVLDDGVLQLHSSFPAADDQEAAFDYRGGRCLLRCGDRHVARTLPDCGAVRCLTRERRIRGELTCRVGRRVVIFGSSFAADGAAYLAVFQIHSHHFHLGDESGRAPEYPNCRARAGSRAAGELI